MTVQVKEFDLLIEVYKWLRTDGTRPELATALRRAINRMHQEQERAWARNHRPEPVPEYIKKRLEKDDVPLMQRLLDAGYPAEEMDHHESDLYIYVTPLTTKVIEQWAMNDQATIDDVKSIAEELRAEVKSGKMSRARLNALKPFIAVVRELVEILGPFLELQPDPEPKPEPPAPAPEKQKKTKTDG